MKRIVILGAGESGVGAAILAKKQGFDTFVSDFGAIKKECKEELDSYEISWEEKQHTFEKILSADEIIKSPGIPDKAEIIVRAKEAKIPIISEIEFAGRYSKAKMICITGSNGKTTTTMLIYHILKKCGVNVGLAGNVGYSLAKQVAEKNYEYYVVELSSFQLDNMYHFKPYIAILLNITPDHLDRYDYKFENYVDSKFRITQNLGLTDYFIYWQGDKTIENEIKKRTFSTKMLPFGEEKNGDNRAFTENENLVVKMEEEQWEIPISQLSIKGKHNILNSMAASLAANIIMKNSDFIKESLQDFNGVPHRLEYVATIKDVTYINDSKATNINSCWYALQSMQSKVVLILGGTDKGNDYKEIEELVKEKVTNLIFLGADNSKLHNFFDNKIENIYDASSMKECLKIAYKIAKRGETVLLSPACASFDLFKNYEDRGEQFKYEVKNL